MGNVKNMADVKNVSEQFKPSNRSTVVDQIIESSLESSDYSNQIFQRVVAKEVEFKKADFKYTVFDNCYFRKCKFVGCDFTGCKFTGSNFRGAEFSGCKFDYATFEKTIIEDSLLDNSCPSYENLKLNFARSLRTNYQSLGDAEGSNKALGRIRLRTGCSTRVCIS